MKIAISTASSALRIGLQNTLAGLANVQVLPEGLDAPKVDVLVTTARDGLVWAKNSSQLPPVLLLSDNPREARRLLEADLPVWGILTLDATEEALVAALHALSQGLCVGTPNLLRYAAQSSLELYVAAEDALPIRLTERESEVLQMLARGLSNRQIASHLHISENTVKFHLSALYARLNASSRTEAVRIGLQQGLITL